MILKKDPIREMLIFVPSFQTVGYVHVYLIIWI